MHFHDRAFLDGPARITREGHFVGKARVARANNVQDYMPRELGLPNKADGTPYRIFRPAAEIFAKDSLKSALHRPIVMDHPAQDVDAKNWKELSVGDTGGDVLRDGDIMSVPIMVMDHKGVSAVQSTHPEFSWGYSADLDMTPGKFGDAEYDGSIKDVRYNHLAMCGSARGGADLRVTDSLVIIDERSAHLRDHQEKTVKKIMLDGLQVDLADAAAVEVAFGKLQGNLADANTKLGAAEAKVSEHATTIIARDAEIVTLKKAVEDAQVTPQQMRDAAKAYSDTVGKAKALGITVTDAMDEAGIQRAVVDKAMGDAAKSYSDADVKTAFAVLTKDTKVADAGDPLRRAIEGQPVSLGDGFAKAKSARDAWLAAKETAHTGQAA